MRWLHFGGACGFPAVKDMSIEVEKLVELLDRVRAEAKAEERKRIEAELPWSVRHYVDS
jgi:hypothetical protein